MPIRDQKITTTKSHSEGFGNWAAMASWAAGEPAEAFRVVLARENQRRAGVDNVEFQKGEIENIPLPDNAVDVVISNCVINLSGDKPAVFTEMHRVLRPGGRIGISDVVAEDRLSAAERAELGSLVGCIAGALSVSEYRDGLVGAGFVDVEILFTHEIVDGMHAATVRATKPSAVTTCC